MRQKEESDSLIHSIFPKVIAKELIEKALGKLAFWSLDGNASQKAGIALVLQYFWRIDRKA